MLRLQFHLEIRTFSYEPFVSADLFSCRQTPLVVFFFFLSPRALTLVSARGLVVPESPGVATPR